MKGSSTTLDDRDLWILRRLYDLDDISINSLINVLRRKELHPLISDISTMSKPTALYRLKKLARKGYIKIERDPKHRQRKICRLEDKGREIIAEVVLPLEDWAEEFEYTVQALVEGKEEEYEDIFSLLLVGTYYVLRGIIMLMKTEAPETLFRFLMKVTFVLLSGIDRLKREEELFRRLLSEMEERFPALRTLKEMGFDLVQDAKIL